MRTLAHYIAIFSDIFENAKLEVRETRSKTLACLRHNIVMARIQYAECDANAYIRVLYDNEQSSGTARTTCKRPRRVYRHPYHVCDDDKN